jgi:uncharacterized protein (TIGR03067 family)
MSKHSLKGQWKVIGCQLNTVWLPSSIFQYFIYSFPDMHHFHLAWGDLTYPKYVGGFPKSERGKITIHTHEDPPTIDLIPDTGPFLGQAFQGIFHLDHDILKANFAFPGYDRPKAFTAQEHQVYEIWQRL